MAAIGTLMAIAQDRPDLGHQTTGRDRTGIVIDRPNNQPVLTYDSTNKTITIEGVGNVEFYNVTITDMQNQVTVYQTVINGSCDEIDVSFLSSNIQYRIALEDNDGHVYYYTFNAGAIGSTYFGGRTKIPNTLGSRAQKE